MLWLTEKQKSQGEQKSCPAVIQLNAADIIFVLQTYQANSMEL